MPKLYRPKATPVQAEQNTGKNADMHRLLTWVFDNGGTGWVESGYASQGPDMLYVYVREKDDGGAPVARRVNETDWVLLLSYANFKLMNKNLFLETYEYIQEGDKR